MGSPKQRLTLTNALNRFRSRHAHSNALVCRSTPPPHGAARRPAILPRRDTLHHKGPRPAIPARNASPAPLVRPATRRNAAVGHRPGPILAGPLAARYTRGMDAPEKRRWYYPTPGWLVLGSLAVTGLIWLSNWLEWPAWHKGYAVLAAVAGVSVVLAAMLLWWLVALAFRWRFQFGIRTLLVLTLAVAVPCSWLAVRMRQAEREREAAAAAKVEKAKRQKEAAAAIQKLGGSVTWSAASPDLRTGLSDDCVPAVIAVSADRCDDKPTFWNATDVDLTYLRELTELQTLDLCGAERVSSVGLENLKGLRKLRELNLSLIQLRDTDLGFIEGLNQLRVLDLGENYRITDAGLEHLKGLSQLQRLVICRHAGVTDEGVKKLQQALPTCKITR